MSPSYLVFVSDAEELCGVEAFTRLMAQHFGARAASHVLDADLPRLMRALRLRDAVIFNFPVVAWKRKLFAPGLAALTARIMGRDVVVVLHEWLALDWKRRVVLAPVVLLASRLVFSAPEIAAEFAETRLSRLATKRRGIVPIPPNILPSAPAEVTPQAEAVRKLRTGGRLILGQFGSIYPKKQSNVVLQVAAELVRRGIDVGVVFAGSFIRGLDDVEADFFAEAQQMGIADRVIVTGYIRNDSDLAAIFQQIDVFCYLFPEGLTSRRGSVLAAALSGKPVVVNAPQSADALDHHGLYQALLDTGGLRLVPTKADIEAVADAVLAAREAGTGPIDARAEIEALWRTICARIDA